MKDTGNISLILNTKYTSVLKNIQNSQNDEIAYLNSDVTQSLTVLLPYKQTSIDIFILPVTPQSAQTSLPGVARTRFKICNTGLSIYCVH